MLSGLVIDFFYTGSNAIASIFPKVFENEVPRTVVAFAATAVIFLNHLLLHAETYLD